eukprot:m.245040 g.245040  ORF g.245040 m.245040 type:complete len:84 (+) comp58288_c0_seq1:148-399(+)
MKWQLTLCMEDEDVFEMANAIVTMANASHSADGTGSLATVQQHKRLVLNCGLPNPMSVNNETIPTKNFPKNETQKHYKSWFVA